MDAPRLGRQSDSGLAPVSGGALGPPLGSSSLHADLREGARRGGARPAPSPPTCPILTANLEAGDTARPPPAPHTNGQRSRCGVPALRGALPIATGPRGAAAPRPPQCWGCSPRSGEAECTAPSRGDGRSGDGGSERERPRCGRNSARPRDAEGALSHPSPASRLAGRMRGGRGGVVNGAAVRAEFTSREEVGGEGAGWGRERAAAAAAASSSGGGCGCSACAAGGGGTGGGKGGRRRRGLTKGEASAGAGTARGGREGGREGRRAAGGGGPTTMPRVVPDQRSKFENEEFFRKLSRECEVRRRWRWGSPFSPSLRPP